MIRRQYWPTRDSQNSCDRGISCSRRSWVADRLHASLWHHCTSFSRSWTRVGLIDASRRDAVLRHACVSQGGVFATAVTWVALNRVHVRLDVPPPRG